MLMTADWSMYVSRAPMSSRSSTSRNTEISGTSRCSCRFMVAFVSCAVDQTANGGVVRANHVNQGS